jgi:hypothetical protein
MKQEYFQLGMGLEEMNPGRNANEEWPQELEAHERKKRGGPGIENCVVKASAVVNTEGCEIWVKVGKSCESRRWELRAVVDIQVRIFHVIKQGSIFGCPTETSSTDRTGQRLQKLTRTDFDKGHG